MKKIAVLLTCHNRKEKTIHCLKSLDKAIAFCNSALKFDVFLVDDGSTDGTSEAVKAPYPHINILQGNGNLFWNKGMNKAWEKAAVYNYDFYMWLNDDTYIEQFGLVQLFHDSEQFNYQSIICGVCQANDKTISYGGYRLGSKKRLTPQGEPIRCDYFNGNAVLVPQSVYNKIGKLDPIFHHAQGDFDYGLRAKKAGIESYISSIVIAKCNRHSRLSKWCDPKTSIKERYKAFNSPLGGRPKTTFIFQNRHLGFLPAAFHFFTIHLRLLFPGIFINRSD